MDEFFGALEGAEDLILVGIVAWGAYEVYKLYESWTGGGSTPSPSWLADFFGPATPATVDNTDISDTVGTPPTVATQATGAPSQAVTFANPLLGIGDVFAPDGNLIG